MVEIQPKLWMTKSSRMMKRQNQVKANNKEIQILPLRTNKRSKMIKLELMTVRKIQVTKQRLLMRKKTRTLKNKKKKQMRTLKSKKRKQTRRKNKIQTLKTIKLMRRLSSQRFRKRKLRA